MGDIEASWKPAFRLLSATVVAIRFTSELDVLCRCLLYARAHIHTLIVLDIREKTKENEE